MATTSTTAAQANICRLLSMGHGLEQIAGAAVLRYASVRAIAQGRRPHAPRDVVRRLEALAPADLASRAVG